MISKEHLQIPFYQEKYKVTTSPQEMITIDKQEINKSFPTQWLTDKLKKAIDHGNVEWAATSGTTSDRLHIIRPKNWWDNEYCWLNHNLFMPNKSIKRAVLTTALCSANVCSLTQPGYGDRCLQSALYLNLHSDPNCWQKADIERMLQEIDLWEPQYLLADPVYLLLFIKKMLHFNLARSKWPFSKIIVGYELLTHFNRKIIKSFFPGLYLQQLYGSTETGFHILESPSGQLKCHYQNSEIILRKWKEKVYEIIISSWKNPYMPLINYVIGDLVAMDDATTPIIQHPDKISAFLGRKKDIFRFRNSEYTTGEIDQVLGRSEVDMAQYQIQVSGDQIHLFYTQLTDEPLSSGDKTKIIELLKTRIPENFDIEFFHRSSISPEVSGKFSIII